MICFKQLQMRILLFLFFSSVSFPGWSQTYISLVPSLTNTAGTIREKSNVSFEVGRQWDVFSLGADIGKTTFGKTVGRDTTTYLEIRPNLNIFQQGKFTNTLTPGIGFIFNAEENFMTELTSGIEYSYTPLIHFNMYFGQYYYSGKYSASTVTFIGISIMKYFAPAKGRSLFVRKSATTNEK